MYLRLLLNILLFQKRIFFPSIFISIILSYIFYSQLKNTGFLYLLIAPTLHYFIYEIFNSKEYYYYYNLGLPKNILWGTTFVLGAIVQLINLLL